MLTAVRLGGRDAALARSERQSDDTFAFTAGDYSGVAGPGQLHLRFKGQPLQGGACEVPPRQLMAERRLRRGSQ